MNNNIAIKSKNGQKRVVSKLLNILEVFLQLLLPLYPQQFSILQDGFI